MVGHSQGTTQTFAGMGLIPEWYDENVSVAALMGPCTTPNQKYFGDMYTKENWDFLQENNIYVIAGPNWEADRAKIMADGPEILKTSIASLEHLMNNPIQAAAAYAQTSMSSRFQRYTEEKVWWGQEHYPEAKHHSELMDYGLVKDMKVAMYVGLFDDTCPLVESQKIYEDLGEFTAFHWVVAPW